MWLGIEGLGVVERRLYSVIAVFQPIGLIQLVFPGVCVFCKGESEDVFHRFLYMFGEGLETALLLF